MVNMFYASLQTACNLSNIAYSCSMLMLKTEESEKTNENHSVVIVLVA